MVEVRLAAVLVTCSLAAGQHYLTHKQPASLYPQDSFRIVSHSEDQVKL
jgi:hypothetical protein